MAVLELLMRARRELESQGRLRPDDELEEQARALVDHVSSEPIFASLDDADIEAIALLVVVQSSESANKDLKEIMEEVREINSRKADQRRLLSEQQSATDDSRERSHGEAGSRITGLTGTDEPNADTRRGLMAAVAVLAAGLGLGIGILIGDSDSEQRTPGAASSESTTTSTVTTTLTGGAAAAPKTAPTTTTTTTGTPPADE